MKTLQESYNLFFSGSLKQLQESQTTGDVKVEEKVILLKHEAISRFLVLLHDLQVSGKEMTLKCVHMAKTWSLCKYLEISVLFINCNLTLAVISLCDILICALHDKRKESFIFLTLLFRSHSAAALGILLYEYNVIKLLLSHV